MSMRPAVTLFIVATLSTLAACRDVSSPIAPEVAPVARRADTHVIELPVLTEVTGVVRGQHLVVEATIDLNGWAPEDLQQPGGWRLGGSFAADYGTGLTHFLSYDAGRWVVTTHERQVTGSARIHVTSRRFRLQVPLRALGDDDGEVFWYLSIYFYTAVGYGSSGRSYGGVARRSDPRGRS